MKFLSWTADTSAIGLKKFVFAVHFMCVFLTLTVQLSSVVVWQHLKYISFDFGLVTVVFKCYSVASDMYLILMILVFFLFMKWICKRIHRKIDGLISWCFTTKMRNRTPTYLTIAFISGNNLLKILFIN